MQIKIFITVKLGREDFERFCHESHSDIGLIAIEFVVYERMIHTNPQNNNQKRNENDKWKVA